MAEIDRLEINIAAEASQAEAHIIRLANQLERLGTVSRASSVSLQRLVDSLNSVKINSADNIQSSVEHIVSAINKLNDIKIPVDIHAFASRIEFIQNAVNKFKIDESFGESVSRMVTAINQINGVELESSDEIRENITKVFSIFGALNNTNITVDANDIREKLSAISEAANAFQISTKIADYVAILEVAVGKINAIKIESVDSLIGVFDKLSGLTLTLDSATIKNKLDELSKAIKAFKVDEKFATSVSVFVQTIQSLNNVNISVAGIDSAVSAMQKIDEALSIARKLHFTENNITTFENFLKQFEGLGKIHGIEEFAARIASLQEAINRLNSIDYGTGFTNLVRATGLLQDVGYRVSQFSIENSFITSIMRVARAAEILESVDFSGFNRMNDAFAHLPDNVRVSFGASTSELRDMVTMLERVTSATRKINANLTEIAARRRRSRANTTAAESARERQQPIAPAVETPEQPQNSYEWQNAELTAIIDRANALSQEQRAINAVINAYHTLGEQVPPEIQRIADRLNGVANIRIDYSWGNEAVRSTIERANELQAEQREIARVIHAYEELGQQAPDDVLQRARELRQPTEYQPNFAWRSEEIRMVQESAQHHERERAEIQRVIEAYREMGQSVPAEIRRIAQSLNVKLPETPFHKFSNAVTKASLAVAKFSLKTVMAPITSVTSVIGKAVTKLSEFWRAMKRIAMYRALRTAIKAITDGFNEGRKNLYQYSLIVGTEFAPSMDKAATAALYLKNSIGAATAPLTNYFVPILDSLVDKLVDVINGFNEMTAVLTGADTWTRAIKYPTQWEEAADDATSAAKKLKSTMLGFDELNVIEPPTDSSKTSGFNADDYARMFEEVRTQYEMPETLGEIIQPIKLAWDNEGQNTLDEIKSTWEKILALVHSVGESFKEVWTNGTGQQTLELILQITQDIIGSFGDLAEQIRLAWDENDKGTQIIQSAWNIMNNVLTLLRDIWSSTREWVQGLDFNPLFESLNEILAVIDEITAPTSALSQTLKFLWNEIILPIGKWVIETLLPKLLSLTANILKLANTISQKLQPALKWVTDNLIKPAGSLVGTTLGLAIDGLGELVDLIDKLANGESIDLSDNLSLSFWKDFSFSNFAEWWEIGARDMFGDNNPIEDFVANFSENWATGFSDIWKNITSALDEWDWGVFSSKFWEKMGENMFDDDQKIIKDWNDFWGKIGENMFDEDQGIIKKFKDGWNDAVNFWAKLFEGAGALISGVFTTIETISEQRINSIKTSFKKAGDSIEKKWTTTKTSLMNGWDNIKTKVTETKQHFIDKFDEIKTNITEKWETLKSNLKSGWDSVKEKIDDFARKWNDGFETIKTYVTNGIQAAKDAVTNSTAWQFFEGIGEAVAGFFDKGLAGIPEKIGATLTNVLNAFQQTDFWKFFSGIGSAIYGFFDTGFTDVSKAVGQFVKDISDKIKNLWDDGNGGGIKGWVTGIASSIASSVKGIFDTLFSGDFLNSILDQIETIINFFIEGLNGLIQLAREFAGGFLSNIPAYDIPEFHFPGRYAKGGFPPKGQLFIANESGAEMVGKFGSQTAVANNQQIVDGVSQGVYSAVIAAFNQLNGSDSNDKTINLNVFLDGRQITAAVEETQRNKGISIMRGVSYT